MTVPTSNAYDRVEISDPSELWDWLSKNHIRAESVWPITWKKRPGAPYVSREDVLDALVAFGWIDGIRRKVDDTKTMQLISPRKQQVWARSYQVRAERLISEGRMMPAGQRAIEGAKETGLWAAWDDVDQLEVPQDLEEALAARGDSAAWFLGAAPSYPRNILRFLRSAKRADTRAKRITVIAEHAAAGKKLPNYQALSPGGA